MRLTLRVLAAAGFGWVAAARADAPAVRRAGDVKLDGRLDEPAWSAAAWQTDFVRAEPAGEGAFQRAEVQTRFKVLFDDDALYVAIECDEPSLDTRVTRWADHDREIYNDDSVEFFLDPAGEGSYYQHFIVNSKGSWCDEAAADYGLVRSKLWNFPLEAGAAADDAAKTWTVEVRLPLAALPFAVPPGSDWLWNVTRTRRAGGGEPQYSTWSPLRGSFHSPRQFRKLTGLNPDYRRFQVEIGEPRIAVSGDGSGFLGMELSCPLRNRTGAKRSLTLSARVFGAATGVVSRAMTLESGESAEASVPSLRVPAGNRQALIQLDVTDAETGARLRTAVKQLGAEYQPVRLEVLEPVFRNNVYATQSLSNLVARVELAPDLSARANLLDLALVDAHGRAAATAMAPGGADRQTLTLAIADLPVGDYRLRVRALGKDGSEIARQETVVRKLPPAPGVEVRVDEKRNLLVNGKPVVLLGWYGTVDTADPRADVVALQNAQTPVVCEGLDLTKIREAWAKGIYSFICVQPGTMTYTFSWWRDPALSGLSQEVKTKDRPSEQYLSYLRQVVEAVRNEPGVLGYYLSDEPEINDHRSDYLEACFRILQELDPYRVVMITNDTLDGIATHGYRACDLLNPDPYNPAWGYVPSFLRRALEVAPRGKGLLLTPWASCNQTHMNHAWGSAPPYPFRVLRNQALVSVCLEARGLTSYTSAFFRPEPVLRYGMPHIWRELRFLEPAMADPQEKPAADDGEELETWLGRAGGHLYLLAVNLRSGSRTATLRHPLLAGIESLYCVTDGRDVPVRDGAFPLELAEGDAQLLTTDPAGRALATAAKAEEEIAAQVAATLKPGNLLHAERGGRAVSSPGHFAPWFTQYYYYAINGVTDDLGWHLSHAEPPGWLEISLPREERIGRVVVHTPNLKDFDLQFAGSDGTRTVAEIRDNSEPEVTVRFAAPVPALKLRLVALAVRPGAKPARPQVSEIEAYADPGNGPATPVRRETAVGASGSWAPLPGEAGPDPTLWNEDFSGSFPDEALEGWAWKPGSLLLEPADGGGLAGASADPQGYASLSRTFPMSKDHRYLQLWLRDLEPRGYRWFSVYLSTPSGNPQSRQALSTIQPGIYTIDTHAVNPRFRTGAETEAQVQIWFHGSARKDDGTVEPGARGTIGWLRQVRRPANGLVVTLGDGAPLPDTLRAGDTLMFRLFLEQPATDAAVDLQRGHTYDRVPVNGEPYVQLYKVGAKDGRAWAARVKLGKGTGQAPPNGYPLLFQARIAGGAIPHTMMSAAVAIE